MIHSLDRLASALASDDLSITDHRGDADFIAALGMASRKYPIASPLVRMYLSHDKASAHDARRIAADMAGKAARRAGIKLRMSELVALGRLALEYVVNKTCCRCHGTKFELIPGTNCLGSVPCKSCSGDGRRQLPKKHRRVIAEVVSRIERVESNLDVFVARKL